MKAKIGGFLDTAADIIMAFYLVVLEVLLPLFVGTGIIILYIWLCTATNWVLVVGVTVALLTLMIIWAHRRLGKERIK